MILFLLLWLSLPLVWLLRAHDLRGEREELSWPEPPEAVQWIPELDTPAPARYHLGIRRLLA